jgi:hypothetical protein
MAQQVPRKPNPPRSHRCLLKPDVHTYRCKTTDPEASFIEAIGLVSDHSGQLYTYSWNDGRVSLYPFVDISFSWFVFLLVPRRKVSYSCTHSCAFANDLFGRQLCCIRSVAYHARKSTHLS